MRRQTKSARILQKSLLGCASAVALSAVFAVPAYAQDANSAPAKGNDEIVVTAQFRQQNLQDTPIAITAQTGEMLAERGITTTKQLVTVAPNVNLTPNASVFGVSTSVFIRGIGQYDNSFAYEPGVGL